MPSGTEPRQSRPRPPTAAHRGTRARSRAWVNGAKMGPGEYGGTWMVQMALLGLPITDTLQPPDGGTHLSVLLYRVMVMGTLLSADTMVCGPSAQSAAEDSSRDY